MDEHDKPKPTVIVMDLGSPSKCIAEINEITDPACLAQIGMELFKIKLTVNMIGQAITDRLIAVTKAETDTSANPNTTARLEDLPVDGPMH